jgi:hypothetical protein
MLKTDIYHSYTTATLVADFQLIYCRTDLKYIKSQYIRNVGDSKLLETKYIGGVVPKIVLTVNNLTSCLSSNCRGYENVTKVMYFT